jgi:transcriptional regulator with XRE-family HTH domain
VRKLREIRHWRNLSQEELAAKVNITFRQIQKYEIGTNRISAGRLHDLSQILEVSIEDFFAGLESRTEGNNALPVQPSACSSDKLCKVFCMFTAKVCTDPSDDLRGAEQAGRFDNGPLAMHPMRFNRIQPGTFDR